MEEDKIWKFVCKWCHKKYPCGKSLGGHMKSHVIANSSESEKKVEVDMKNFSTSSDAGQHNLVKDSDVSEFVNGQSSYGLRENPKKTWRAVDSRFILAQEKVCKQCGKGFQSLKALCGHMACHSDKDKSLKDDQSWASENRKLVLDSYSDTETGDRVLRTRLAKSKRYSAITAKLPFYLENNGSSSVSEYDRLEQEEVAICLMLLSMDSLNKDGVNSFVESSDNNSVVLETKSSSTDTKLGDDERLNHVHNWNQAFQIKKITDRKMKDEDFDGELPKVESSDSGYFLDECAKADSDVSANGYYRDEGYDARFRNRLNKITTELRMDLKKENWYDDSGTVSNSARLGCKAGNYSPETPELWQKSGKKMKKASPDAGASNHPPKRSKYECFNCKKVFKSFQALGGHRPCHKRSNISETVYESDENHLDDSAEFRPSGKVSSKALSHYADKKVKSSKNKGHVCPFCQRVFKNGQALGGHKRSHFIGGHLENVNPSPVIKLKLLDLNLPAPEEGEDDGQCQFVPT